MFINRTNELESLEKEHSVAAMPLLVWYMAEEEWAKLHFF